MLNDLQIEAAVQKLCELRGWNTDDSQTMMRIAEVEIRAADQVREAIVSVDPFTDPRRVIARSNTCQCGHDRSQHAPPPLGCNICDGCFSHQPLPF